MAVLQHILPVFAIIVLGRLLSRQGFLPLEFFRVADRLVYYILFPLMLFWKIGGAGTINFHWPLILAALLAALIAYLLGLLYVKAANLSSFKVGAFAQLCIRINSYVAFPIVLSATGDAGVRVLGVIFSVMVPFLNVLSVGTLIWSSTELFEFKAKVRLVLKEILANPLILGCLAGLAYAALGRPLPIYLDRFFSLLSAAALPLALMSIGRDLSLARLEGQLGPALVAGLIKIAILPLFGYLFMKALGVTGLYFTVGLIYFALPTAPSVYILSAQLGSDAKLASAGIVLSLLLSFLSLSLALHLGNAL